MNSMKLVIPFILFHDKRLQTMLWHLNTRVNSHQRWKQTRFRVCFHLWCELTSTMNVTEWQVSWNSCKVQIYLVTSTMSTCNFVTLRTVWRQTNIIGSQDTFRLAVEFLKCYIVMKFHESTFAVSVAFLIYGMERVILICCLFLD